MKRIVTRKLNPLRLAGFLLFLLFVVGCALPGADAPPVQSGGDESPAVVDGGRSLTASSSTFFMPNTFGPNSPFAYPYGAKYLLDGTEEFRLMLGLEYATWKEKYVTSSGAGGYMRVQRDAASDYDTVSEGIGYGMLLGVYCDDLSTVWQLYQYSLLHKCERVNALMHWKVDKNGKNVSEFKIPVADTHRKAYLKKDTFFKEYDEERTYVAEDNADRVNNPQNYLPASTQMRKRGSAADADLDMAAAMVLAAYRSGGGDFITAAAKYLVDLENYIFALESTKKSFIRNGTLWGSPEGWNPSYFTPAWIRLFTQFVEDFQNNSYFKRVISNPSQYLTRYKDLLTVMYAHMKKLYVTSGAVLFPDWCDTSGTAMVKANASDRRYYLDENRDNRIDDRNNDGVIDENDAVSMMSFNSYYDAVRVPWRLALAYSWYGDTEAYALANKMLKFFKGKNYGLNIVDGYSITGGAWNRSDRDGFNNLNLVGSGNQNGGQAGSTAFNAMCATAFMLSSRSGGESLAQKVYATNDYGNSQFNYYGNTLRLLSLLYLSGRFTPPKAMVKVTCEANNKGMSVDFITRRFQTNYASTLRFIQNAADWISIQYNGKFAQSVPYYDGSGSRNGSWMTANSASFGGEFTSYRFCPTNDDNGVLKFALYGKTTSSNDSWRWACADLHVNPTKAPILLNRVEIGPWERFSYTIVR